MDLLSSHRLIVMKVIRSLSQVMKVYPSKPSQLVQGIFSMWSIGVYRGESPLSLQPHPDAVNPVIHPQDVSDLRGVSVADPFIIQANGIWHMFFEVLDGDSGKGCIALATSEDGVRWKYQHKVIDERFHLSYPYVFSHNGEYYMIPETVEGGGVSLYRAKEFPSAWEFDRTLIPGRWADPSVFQFNGRWWMFACSRPKESDSLHLFHSTNLFDGWVEHPQSPLIVGDNRTARPAGRVVVLDDKIIRFAQDCYPKYGSRVRGFEITKLTPDDYQERETSESPVLAPTGSGWNSERMHHVDPHLRWPAEWLACVDGLS